MNTRRLVLPGDSFHRRIESKKSPDEIWRILTDADLVASWVSVVGQVEELEHLDRYSAVLEDRLGPFSLRADLDIRVDNLEVGSLIAFHAEGEDRQVGSRITVDASMRLESTPPLTTVEIAGTYDVAGGVAGLGPSVIRSKANKILGEFVDAATGELEGT